PAGTAGGRAASPALRLRVEGTSDPPPRHHKTAAPPAGRRVRRPKSARPAEPDRYGPAVGLLLDVTPLRVSRDFRRLWAGQAVSFVGSTITMASLPYQVFHQT